MEREGLVRKHKDPARRNLVRVSLTEKGQQAYRQSTHRESLKATMSCLNAAEQAQFYGYLERLRDRALEYLGVAEKPPFPPAVE